MPKRYSRSNRKSDMPALQKAGSAAERFNSSGDEDLAHIGNVLGRIISRAISMRLKEQEKRNQKGEKRIFYTSAEASAPKD